ncbi:MAG TPA: PAS domain S-box protein [Puia sp.]|nr:PAS domain S-box protein [Puia sp.]
MNVDTKTAVWSDSASLSHVIDRITDGFFAVDPDGNYTYMNKKAEEVLRSGGEGANDPLTGNVFADDKSDAFFKSCQKALAHQQYQCLESYRAPEGRWTEYHIYPSPTGLSILFQDITDRKNKEEAREKAELRYHNLIEQASDAIMITDQQGMFLEVNTTLCNLFGYTKEELLQSNISRLLDPVQLKNEPIQFALLASGQPVLRERRMLHKDGTIIEVEANVKLTPDGRLLAIARDITERKRAAQQILREKEISESIINSLPGVFLLREYPGNILRWNDRFESVSGYSPEEIPHLPGLQFFEEKDKDHMRQRVQKLLAEGKSSSEIVVVTKDGRRIPFYLTGKVMNLDGKTCLIIIGLDISERKKAEEELSQANEQLRDLSVHLQNIREDERKRIALEIHDELGQQLTALKMDLSWAIKKTTSEGIIYPKLSGMNMLIDQTIASVRRISSELRPSILDDLGLAEALDWQSVEFAKRYRIRTNFHSNLNELKLNPNIVTGLFRIYQESLTNVARHAQAKTVVSSLDLVEGQLILKIADDGSGFDTQTVENKGTFGLIGIKERTLMMGGAYTISSSPDKGTMVTISIPV